MDEAIAILVKAAESERDLGYWEPPHYARPLTETIAMVQARAGNFDRAIAAWNEALRLRPRSGHALFGLAETLRAAGRQEEAKRMFAEFLDAWSDADSNLPQITTARARLRE